MKKKSIITIFVNSFVLLTTMFLISNLQAFKIPKLREACSKACQNSCNKIDKIVKDTADVDKQTRDFTLANAIKKNEIDTSGKCTMCCPLSYRKLAEAKKIVKGDEFVSNLK